MRSCRVVMHFRNEQFLKQLEHSRISYVTEKRSYLKIVMEPCLFIVHFYPDRFADEPLLWHLQWNAHNY